MRRISRGVPDRGVSIVELLVVLAILGVLSAGVVLTVGDARTESRKSACKADVSSVQKAAEAYFAKNGAYPSGDDAAGIAAMVAAKLLSAAPSTSRGYAVTYWASTGAVGSIPACSALT